MTDDSVRSTLQQVKAAELSTMPKDQKVAYRGWRMQRGNRWQAGNGFVASFGKAVRVQALADMERPT